MLPSHVQLVSSLLRPQGISVSLRHCRKMRLSSYNQSQRSILMIKNKRWCGWGEDDRSYFLFFSFLFSSIRKTRVWSSEARVKSRLALQFYMTFIFQRRKMVKKTNQTKTKTENYSLKFFSVPHAVKMKGCIKTKVTELLWTLRPGLCALCLLLCVSPSYTKTHTNTHTHKLFRDDE